jgi:hypothetical protein
LRGGWRWGLGWGGLVTTDGQQEQEDKEDSHSRFPSIRQSGYNDTNNLTTGERMAKKSSPKQQPKSKTRTVTGKISDPPTIAEVHGLLVLSQKLLYEALAEHSDEGSNIHLRLGGLQELIWTMR